MGWSKGCRRGSQFLRARSFVGPRNQSFRPVDEKCVIFINCTFINFHRRVLATERGLAVRGWRRAAWNAARKALHACTARVRVYTVSGCNNGPSARRRLHFPRSVRVPSRCPWQNCFVPMLLIKRTSQLPVYPAPSPSLLASQLNLPFPRCFFLLFDFGEFWSFCCEEFSIVIRTLLNGWRYWDPLERKVNRVVEWNTWEDFGFDGSVSEVCPRIEFKRWAFAFGFVTGLGGPRAPRRKLWPLRSLSFFFVRDCHTRVWKVDVHLIKSNDPFFLLSSRNDLRPKQHGSWIVQSAVQSTAANSIKKFHTAAWIRKRRPTRYRISPEGREKERERERERERRERERESGYVPLSCRVSAVPIILLFCAMLWADAWYGSSCITLPVTQ